MPQKTQAFGDGVRKGLQDLRWRLVPSNEITPAIGLMMTSTSTPLIVRTTAKHWIFACANSAHMLFIWKGRGGPDTESRSVL